jgi:hypothetical protein
VLRSVALTTQSFFVLEITFAAFGWFGPAMTPVSTAESLPRFATIEGVWQANC